MKRLLILFLLLTLPVSADPAGTLKDPFKKEGPQGSWVSNGHWNMRLLEVKRVTQLENYLKLPWTHKLQGETRSEHLKYMKERVFGAKKQVVLITVEANNPGDTRDFHRDVPHWKLRTDSATTGGPNSHHEGVAMNCLEGGMPIKGKLKNGETGRGTLVFHVPDYAFPTTLFFEANRHSVHGETQSLALRVAPPTGAKKLNPATSFPPSIETVEDPAQAGSWKKPFRGKGPVGAWVSNGHWMMRVTAVGEITNQADYEALPWNKRFDNETREKHFRYSQRSLFKPGKRVYFLTLEAKNLNDKIMEFGVNNPPWKLGVTGRENPISTGLHHQQLAIWCLEGGMPKRTKLNKGGKAKGMLLFFLKANEKPEKLFFKTNRHSPHGETGSLTIDL